MGEWSAAATRAATMAGPEMPRTTSKISRDGQFAERLAMGGQPQAYLDWLATLYKRRVGWKMLTLMTFDPKRRLARRVYTTDEENYPVSADKPMTDSDWGDLVLKGREVFVARRHEEFKPHFVDWEKLRALGMEAAVNFPIVLDDAVLGTVNLTAGRGFYTAARVAAGKRLAPFAALGFLLIERAPRASRKAAR